MAFWVFSGGHDMKSRISLDSFGQLYRAFTTVWTMLLLFGIALLATESYPSYGYANYV